MKTRKEAITYCKSFSDVYEDYPFHDNNWTVMRIRKNKKSFAYIYEREGCIWVNVKCSPEWIEVWREAFTGVIPGFHMNKKYWNTIMLNGSVPDKEIRRMIGESYDLMAEKKS